mgnify:CR=1 FL=1
MINRNTKIVCTLGPAINNEEMLIKMFNAGMNVARLNFSHNTPETGVKLVKTIKNAATKAKKNIAILLDTKGPEIRTGIFENGGVVYEAGDIVKLVKEEVIGNKERFYITCKELFDDVVVGSSLLVDDGKITLKVINVSENEITCEFINGGLIKNQKGINAPGTNLSMPFVSEKDYCDIKFCCEQGLDAIALSFVRTPEDVLEVKKLVATLGRPNIEIISKIECKQAIDNLEEILKVSDGIMVARGDLGVEVAPELVPLYQKKMIKLANQYGKVVITATHMLESMIENPRPTRAEASDVANAILDGTDAIMLSGESAIGAYPLESVEMMDRIALSSEKMINYQKRLGEEMIENFHTQNDAISICACECAVSIPDIVAIFAFTETGGTAKRICRYRPSVPLIACTDSIDTCRRLSYYCGIFPTIAKYVDDISMCDDIANEVAISMDIEDNSNIIVVGGFGQKHGVTNTIRIIEVEH